MVPSKSVKRLMHPFCRDYLIPVISRQVKRALKRNWCLNRVALLSGPHNNLLLLSCSLQQYFILFLVFFAHYIRVEGPDKIINDRLGGQVEVTACD